jgi:hypothetical protein
MVETIDKITLKITKMLFKMAYKTKKEKSKVCLKDWLFCISTEAFSLFFAFL